MIYEYFCGNCNAVDEVVRQVSEASDPYQCIDCGLNMIRSYTAPNVVTKGEDIASFNPAFGRVMTEKEAKVEAKRRGWIEVGNEDVAKHTAPPKRVDYECSDYSDVL